MIPIQQIQFEDYDIFHFLKVEWANKYGSQDNPFDAETYLWRYFTDMYGERIIFKKIHSMLTNETMSGSNAFYIAKCLSNMYFPKWKHEHDLLNLEYNPIENYNKLDITNDSTHTDGKGKSKSTNKVRPYDLLDNTFVDNTQNESDAENESNISFEHTNRTSGNIGVTTTQQMMEQEQVFWQKYNVYMLIFKDIANYIGKGVC